MNEAPPDRRGAALVLVYVTLWFAGVLVLSVVGALVALTLGGGARWADDALVFGTFGQMVLSLALMPVSHRLVARAWSRRTGEIEEPWRWPALSVPAPRWWAVALAVGLCTGWVSGVLAGWLVEAAPWLPHTSLDAITAALTEGPWVRRAAFGVLVVVGAPLVEELMFRHYVWEALARRGGQQQALVGSSLLFAAYHLDPVHAISLLPTAFALGWVRWCSGSVLLVMGVHALNNGLGVGLAWSSLADVEPPMSWVLLNAAVSLAACGAAWRWSSGAVETA